MGAIHATVLSAVAGRPEAKDVLQYTYVAGYYPEPSDKETRHEVEVILLNKDKGQLSGGKRVVVR
jgi:hypothetical protein